MLESTTGDLKGFEDEPVSSNNQKPTRSFGEIIEDIQQTIDRIKEIQKR